MKTIDLTISISEADVINKIIAGEKELFEILVRRNNPFLYKTAMSFGFTHHDSQDLMQEAFIAAYLNLGKFQQRSSFKTWVIRIMLNLCYKKSHKLSFINERPGYFQFADAVNPLFASKTDKDPVQSIQDKELAYTLENAVICLPLKYRMVFSLRELAGLSTPETAQALEISETNVKVRLNRARHMLKDKIKETYSLEDIFGFHLVYCDKISWSVMNQIL